MAKKEFNIQQIINLLRTVETLISSTTYDIIANNASLKTSSGEKINTVDSDGTAEYLCVDAEVVVVTKVSDTDGWTAVDLPALGGVGAATVPD